MTDGNLCWGCLWVVLLDALEAGVEDLDGGELASADEAREFSCGMVREVRWHGWTRRAGTLEARLPGGWRGHCRGAAPQRGPARASSLPFPHERHGATERRLPSLELPREAAEDQPLVLQLGRLDLAAQVLDVDAVFGEERVVGELVGAVGEQPVHRRLAAEFLLGLGAHLVALTVHPFAEEAPD